MTLGTWLFTKMRGELVGTRPAGLARLAPSHDQRAAAGRRPATQSLAERA